MSGAPLSRVRALVLAAALLAALPAFAQDQDYAPPDAPGQERPVDPVPAPKPFRPVDLLLGAGSENFSRAGTFSGGNYAYLELALRFFGHFTAAARVSAELVPDPFAELLAVGGLELLSPRWGPEFYTALSVSWALDLRDPGLLPGVVVVGFRPIDSGFELGEFSMSILPLSLTWDLATGALGFGYEFLKLRVVLD
ncbi:MAG: hypothetical protein JXA15_14615 [Spirochaetales bacterium]|nr:hypothetical protein [Spirochaetales bacterium]